MLRFTTVYPESFGETRCNGHAGERGKCTLHSSRPKGKLRSHSSEGQNASGNPMHVFIWTGKLDQEFSVQKR